MKIRNHKFLPFASTLFLAFATIAADIRAQTTTTKRSLADAMKALREHGQIETAVGVLRREVASADSPAFRDSLADSIAAFVVKPTGKSAATRTAKELAIRALWESGRPANGTPYQGAADRLFLAQKTADDSWIRVVALTQLASLGEVVEVTERKRIVEMLRTIAVSNSDLAFASIDALAGGLRSKGGLAVLRTLLEQKLITEQLAKTHLRDIARRNGWSEP